MGLSIRERLFRAWYWYVSKIDKKAEVLFMNFGYSDNKTPITLDAKDEDNRYSIQLYHHLAIETDLKNKDLVEIGSGRGGGLNYVCNAFAPKTALGVEKNGLAVSFCNNFYKNKGLSFIEGDAQELQLPSNCCDVVINVESSHRYPNIESFYSEVYRILRPNGYFLFTDFRFDYNFDTMRQKLLSCGLKLVTEKNINKEVVNALTLDDSRKRNLVKKLTPRVLHKIALNFAGTIGSETYNNFETCKYVYSTFVLKK